MSGRHLAFLFALVLVALAAPVILRHTTPAANAATPPPQAASGPVYFPDRLDWQHKKPEDVGFDSAKLNDAIKSAIAHETTASKSMEAARLRSYPREPYLEALGPIKDRGPATGIIIRHGYIVAEWGDPGRVDMTFSVSKTFLTTVIGLAWQRGLIRDVKDYARDYMPAGVDLFEAPHNQKIRWDDLLRQSSDWSGTLWGKPDWADRPLIGVKPEDYPNREMFEPGAHYKYNDVRVNAMAYAATEVWRRPLPQVLREEIMDPIGASSTWRWYGYDNSWIDMDGQKMQVMTGGGHWGGGMFINAYDMARFGYLFLRDGKWKGSLHRLHQVDGYGPHAWTGQSQLRICELVSQSESHPDRRRARLCRLLRGRRPQYRLYRLG